MSKRIADAEAFRSRIAASLQAAASTEEPASRTLIAGAQGLDSVGGTSPPQTPESGVGTQTGEPLAEEGAQPATPPAEIETPPLQLGPLAAATNGPSATAQPPAQTSTPAQIEDVRAASRGWEKLSITLNQADFEILETQTERARAAGIRMRRGGNPSVFMRAALRHLEALRLTNPAAWATIVRGAAANDHSEPLR